MKTTAIIYRGLPLPLQLGQPKHHTPSHLLLISRLFPGFQPPEAQNESLTLARKIFNDVRLNKHHRKRFAPPFATPSDLFELAE
jgi:hypothetical protein